MTDHTIDLDLHRGMAGTEENPDDPRYRIESIAEKHERIAPESVLMVSKGVFA